MLFSPCFVVPVFCQSVPVFFPVAACFIALDRQDLPFVEYSWEFCRLAAATALDDATILALFWHGANSHRPVDLPDTIGLRWREGILRCLENILPQVRISPPSSAALLPPTVCGKIQPTAVSGQHRVHSRADPFQELTESTPEPAPFQELTERPPRSACCPSTPKRPRCSSTPKSAHCPSTLQCPLLDSALQCLLQDCALQCPSVPKSVRCLSALQCPLLDSALQCPLLDSNLQCPLQDCALQCPTAPRSVLCPSAPKCQCSAIRHGPRSSLIRHGFLSPRTPHGSRNGRRPGGLLSAHPPSPLDGVWRKNAPSGGGRNVRLCFPVSFVCSVSPSRVC